MVLTNDFNADTRELSDPLLRAVHQVTSSHAPPYLVPYAL